MPTMTIRYPEELEEVIQQIMVHLHENTKNGAITYLIKNYFNLMSDLSVASNSAHVFECKYNNLLSRVEVFATAQQKLFDFTELS